MVNLAFANSPKFPVKNYSYVSDYDYQQEVHESNKWVVMVFSDSQCLERAVFEKDCVLFERKFDSFVPSFSKSVKVVGFNTWYENYWVTQNFHLQKKPTVIVINKNQIIKRFEANMSLHRKSYQLGWQNQLLKEVTTFVYKIH